MPAKPARKRLDKLLVERGLADSPQKAQAMILAGEVRVAKARGEKAGQLVRADSPIEVHSRQSKYASRGGLKLEGALEDFGISPAGRLCADLGSSTGGFTDCLLQRGVLRVYAVDVTIDQLAWKLQQDPRVVQIKRNARELSSIDIPELVDLVVVDVSFISAVHVLAPAAAVARPGADILIMVKPQFELRRKQVPAGGVVRDPDLHHEAVQRVKDAARSAGLDVLAMTPSRLPGAEGNLEFFLHLRRPAVK
jgi:23S rRNA (cytidine1920-2'-O)/16S rRNA (cytidine1409-2'-O)-methyltransferase